MSNALGMSWEHTIFVLLFCPSLIALPVAYAIRRAMGRRAMDRRAWTGLTLHAVAILAGTAWYATTLWATLRDVSAGGGYVFIGLIALMPMNGILAILGCVLMLLDERRGPASEPPPIP